MYKLKRYIPTKVYEFIKLSDFKNKEHLFIICDMVNRISIYRKEDDDYSNNFKDIPKVYFSNIITDKNYMYDAFEYLESNNIIICDGVYSKKEGKALGYKYNENFISKLIPVEIDSFTLSRRIIQNVNSNKKIVEKGFTKYKNYFFNNFKIDFEGASKYLDNWFNEEIEKLEFVDRNIYLKNWIKIVNKYNSLFISINAINDGELFFRKNETNGRIDTNLTSLKKDFKKFIKIDGLIQIDIVNSQPFFLSTILYSLLCSRNSPKALQIKEVERFIKWCSEGNLYESFINAYYKDTNKLLNRSEIKEMIFCIFYSKNGSYKNEKNIFRKIFPSILEWIEKQKVNKYNEFSIKLQKIESDICINEILPALEKSNIEYLTIHDSWLINENNLEEALDIIKNKFLDKFGFCPSLKIENL